MQSETIRGELALRWACWTAALLLAGGADAEDLYPGRGFPAADVPASVAVADLDGDGDTDLAIADQEADTVNVLLGNGDGSFQAPVSYPAGVAPAWVAVADLDGDGVPDLVTADHGGVSVLLGNGDGTFQAAVSFPAGDGPVSVAVADLDDDGAPDLVAVNQGSGNLSVLLGNGDGSFQAAVSFPAADHPDSVAVADLDGDGVPDLATASGDVSVLRGNGDGTFQAPVSYSAGPAPRSVAVADVNDDTFPDLVVRVSDVPFGASGVSVLLNDGDGTFQVSGFFPLGLGVGPLAVGDFDTNGVPDVVTVDSLSFASDGGRLSVLLGNGDGTFQPAVSYPAGFSLRAVAVADVDGDGVPDLVRANANVIIEQGRQVYGNGEVRVLPGRGDGSFQAVVSVPVGDRPPVSVAVADLDGDGVPDLVSANQGIPGGESGYVSVIGSNGDRTFRAAVPLPAGVQPVAVAAADLDGDGAADVVTANGGSGDVSALLGNGDGSFQAAVSFPTGHVPFSVAVADLDGDGAADVVTANRDSGDVSALLGNGDGSFQAAVSSPTGHAPFSVAVADLDGDAAPDVVAATARALSVLRGNGDGTFQPAVSYPAGYSLGTVAVADVDADGIPDLVAADRGEFPRGPGPAGVSILRGNGDGTFQAAVSYPGGTRLVAVAVADLDGDRLPDVAAADATAGSVTVFLGNGDGSFRDALSFFSGGGPISVAVADLDGDALPDLVTANFSDLRVLFHLDARLARPEIDIRPCCDVNLVHPLSRGAIPVAILGSDSFRVSEVELTTLAFGPAGAAPLNRNGGWRRDVNRDGFTDLVSLYRIPDTGIGFGDAETCVVGEMSDGTPFEGCDSILTLTSCGLGFELVLVLPPLIWLRRRIR